MKKQLRHEDTYESSMIFRSYVEIIKEPSQKARRRLYKNLGPRKLRRVCDVVSYRKKLLIQPKFVVTRLGKLVREINTFFEYMKGKRKK